MRGRPITNNSHKAQRNREYMRRVREQVRTRPSPFNYQPLAYVLANWNRT